MSELDSIPGAVHPHLQVNPLTNLLDMLKSYAASFFRLGAAINRAAAEVDLVSEPDLVPVAGNRTLLGICREMRDACDELGLVMTKQAVLRIYREPPRTMRRRDLVVALGDIRRRASDELETRQFVYLTPEQVREYQDEFPLGQEIHDRFPKIGGDLREAVRCRVFGMDTAAVFHLTRVLEHGLLFFVERLKVAIKKAKPTWGDYTRELKTEIDKMPIGNASQKKKKAAYLRVYEAFESVREAWRNPVAHDLGLMHTANDTKNMLDRTKQIFEALIAAFPKRGS